MTTWAIRGLMLAAYGKALKDRDRLNGWARPDVGRLTADFLWRLKQALKANAMPAWLDSLGTGDEMAIRIAKVNRKDRRIFDTCHARAYIDVDRVMIAAWSGVTGVPYDKVPFDSATFRRIAQQAWDLAMLFDFRLEFEVALDIDGNEVHAFGVSNNGMFITNARLSECTRFAQAPSYYKLSEKAADTLTRLNAGRNLIA